MALLVIGGLVLIGALVLVYQLRSARRDSRSVKAHHLLLDRLQHAAEANPELPTHPPVGPHVRVVPTSAGRVDTDAPLAAPVEAPPPRTPSVVDLSPAPAPPAAPVPPAGAVPPLDAAPRPQLSAARPAAPHLAPSGLPLAMIHPVGSRHWESLRASLRLRRRVEAAAAALLVAGAGAVVGLAVAGGNRPAGNGRGAHVAAPPGGLSQPTLPTSARTAPTATATSSGPTGATYVVTSIPVDLTLAASNRCWVELRSGSATGPVIFEGLLLAGTSHAFSNSSGVWLRLGYPPGVSVQLDGTRVDLPATAQPYDVSVQTA